MDDSMALSHLPVQVTSGLPEECSHSVQFYGDDIYLVDAVAQFVGRELLAGRGAILIATNTHRDGIFKELKTRGFDLSPALKQGRLLTLEPRETISRFLVDGWPDETRFTKLMAELIKAVRERANKPSENVAIFGEMVSLLWADGNSDAAIRLEELWNTLAETYSFSLLCAYPMAEFDHSEHCKAFVKICAEHRAVIPAESFFSLTTDQERYRAIAALQQRAQALENEIKERKTIEQRLQRREAELWDFLDNAPVAIHWMAADGTILWANRAELRLLGYERHEYVGKPISTFQIDGAAVQDILDRLKRFEDLQGYETRLRHKDGSIRYVQLHSNVFFQHGKFIYIRCFTIDITKQKEGDEARLRLAAIVKSSEDAIISKNLDGIVTSWNSSAERMFGYKAYEIIGRSITLIIPPELQAEETRILSAIRRGERIEHFETVRVAKTGERLEVSLTISPIKDDSGRIIGAAKISRDIRQRKKIEEALRMTEKLAAVGRLASTIAHEVNNPLEAATNLIYLAKSPDTNSETLQKYLSDAEEELRRAAEITKQTLGFYREQKAATRTQISIHLKQLLAVLSSKIKNKSIEVLLEIDQDPEIVAVPGELRQVLANLFTNAIDAVNHNGRIRIHVSANYLWNRDESGVRITFFDSGPGIARHHYANIFEPFFTTKEAVRTGLGLWICKNIVDRHRGRMQVRSKTTPGQSWTAVSVLLPSDNTEAITEIGSDENSFMTTSNRQ